jgi:tripeptidyl-peptidase-1
LGINSAQYVRRVNVELQKLGLKGISVIASSGDSGAHGRDDPLCEDLLLHPGFPASSPFLTSVGATELVNETYMTEPPPICQDGFACASHGFEQAVSFNNSAFTSGGGFSFYSPRPAYQEQAVVNYLNTAAELPPYWMFNSENRGFPDISAIGHNLLIYEKSGGGWLQVGGTSASAPIIAGLMSQLTHISRNITGKPLGFLNPLLYSMQRQSPDTFRDIVIGDNICTEGGCYEKCKGFRCSKDWDPVTGLGVPSVSRMVHYVEEMFAGRQRSNARTS